MKLTLLNKRLPSERPVFTTKFETATHHFNPAKINSLQLLNLFQ